MVFISLKLRCLLPFNYGRASLELRLKFLKPLLYIFDGKLLASQDKQCQEYERLMSLGFQLKHSYFDFFVQKMRLSSEKYRKSTQFQKKYEFIRQNPDAQTAHEKGND